MKTGRVLPKRKYYLQDKEILQIIEFIMMMIITLENEIK